MIPSFISDQLFNLTILGTFLITRRNILNQIVFYLLINILSILKINYLY
jgi:hypothetical protein